MKKLIALLMALVMLLSLAACGGEEKPEASAAPDNGEEVAGTEGSPEADAEVAPEAATEMIPKEEFLALSGEEILERLAHGADTTDEEILALHNYYVYTDISSDGLLNRISELDYALRLLKSDYDVAISNGDLLVDALLTSPSAAVRAHLVAAIYDARNETSPEAMAKVAEFMLAETDPAARASLVFPAGDLANYSDEVMDALVLMAKDEEAIVRRQIPSALSSYAKKSWIMDVIKALIEDEDPLVRAHAGLALAHRQDTSIIPVMSSLLADSSVPSELQRDVHTAAINALSALYGGNPGGFRTPYSEEAYRACLDYIQSEHMQFFPFTVFLLSFTNGVDPDFAENAPWFDVEELISILQGIADSSEDSMVQSSALKTIEKLKQ